MSQPTVPESNVPQSYAHPSDPDEINLLEYAYALVKRKWLIAGVTLLGLIAGLVAAHVKGPSWVSEALIAPKEVESQKTPNLSGLGLFGGMVASQLGTGGNASLDKIDLILDSKIFNTRLAYRYNLLPYIFHKYHNANTGTWKKDFVLPQDSLVVGISLKGEYLKKEIKPNNTMLVTISSKDSAATFAIMHAYLVFLDEYYRSSVQEKARENSLYLENQLLTVTDPLLRAKLQEMIATEVEKQMLVSKEAFQIVDPPYQSKKFKEKKLYPLVFGAGLFFMTVFLVVLAHAFGTAQKTPQDRQLIVGIKKEFLRGPHGR